MHILGQLFPFIVLIAIMYFVIIRPQQKEAKSRKEMIASLKKGDKIVTAGGLIVEIKKVEENFLTVSLEKENNARITKDAVSRKYEDEA
jgi:preprotein translocase subunit YajC